MTTLNAAQVLAKFVWQNEIPKEIISVGKDRKIEIDKTVFLEQLMKFQAFLLASQQQNTGVGLIEKERREQIEKHGYDARFVKNNPNYYDDMQLTWAAIQLFSNDFGYANSREDVPQNWDEEDFIRMQQKEYKERLIIAGALIAAEIDRLQNA